MAHESSGDVAKVSDSELREAATPTSSSRAEPAGVADAGTEATDEPLKPGEMVGEYRIEGLLGRGGMGWVYAGVHPVIEKPVAVKVLKPSLAEDPEAVQRFVSEAKAVNRIGHPNIIDVFAFGQLGSGAPYLVMERPSGHNLRQRLETGAPVSFSEVRHLLAQILDALEAVHDEGIVHRDLKPDNVYLVERSRGPRQVKLLDFGVAKLTEEGVPKGRTRTGIPIGTPAYMSPEQCRGRSVDLRSDLYSLGVVLYEIFTGEVPFASESYMEVIFAQVHNPPIAPGRIVALPEELESLVMWCLQKDPGSRPQSLAALRRPLLACLDRLVEQGATLPRSPARSRDMSTDPPESPDRARDRQKTTSMETSAEALGFDALRGRRRWPLVGGLAVTLTVLVAVGLYYRLRSPSEVVRPSAPRSDSAMEAAGAASSRPMDLAVDPPRTPPPMPATMPAPPPGAQTVMVKLRSTPPGATVYYQGRKVATTPQDLALPRDAKPSAFRFVVEGHPPVTRTITLERDVQVDAELTRARRRPRRRPMRPHSDGFKLTQ